MPQVLNRSKNASTLINGVQFTKTAKGMLSAEITQEQADYFLKMTNYVAVKAAPQAKPQAVPEQDSSRICRAPSRRRGCCRCRRKAKSISASRTLKSLGSPGLFFVRDRMIEAS
jgi:hypothetical protein